MSKSATVDPVAEPARPATGPTLSTRYPVVRRALLDAIRVKRGHGSLAQTVSVACDEMIIRHFGEAALKGGDE
jgi:hypothetical protein